MPLLERNVWSRHKKKLGPNNEALLGTQVQNKLPQVEKRRKICRKKSLSKRDKNASVEKGNWSLN